MRSLDPYLGPKNSIIVMQYGLYEEIVCYLSHTLRCSKLLICLFGPELHLQHQPNHYGIYGGQSENGKVVLQVPPFLPVGIIPPMLHVHISLIYH